MHHLQRDTNWNCHHNIDTKSLINIINKRGPNMDPWGIPLRTSIQQENSSCHCFRLFFSSGEVPGSKNLSERSWPTQQHQMWDGHKAIIAILITQPYRLGLYCWEGRALMCKPFSCLTMVAVCTVWSETALKCIARRRRLEWTSFVEKLAERTSAVISHILPKSRFFGYIFIQDITGL